MRRNLQEGKTRRKVIYEGNGFAQVIENGRVVERIQLERGDNLMEAFIISGPSEEHPYEFGEMEEDIERRNLALQDKIDSLKSRLKEVDRERYNLKKRSKILTAEEYNDEELRIYDKEFALSQESDTLRKEVRRFNSTLQSTTRSVRDLKPLYNRYYIDVDF